MPRPSDPAATRPPAARDLARERARAAGARRMIPWTLLTAVGGGALAYTAGGGLRAGIALGAVGLLFTLFLWTTSIARCPVCGARLPRRAGGTGGRGGPTPGGAETCARCRTRFE
jgi:hypothetical protein